MKSKTLRIAIHEDTILFLKPDGLLVWGDSKGLTEMAGSGFGIEALDGAYGLASNDTFVWEPWVKDICYSGKMVGFSGAIPKIL